VTHFASPGVPLDPAQKIPYGTTVVYHSTVWYTIVVPQYTMMYHGTTVLYYGTSSIYHGSTMVHDDILWYYHGKAW